MDLPYSYSLYDAGSLVSLPKVSWTTNRIDISFTLP